MIWRYFWSWLSLTNTYKVSESKYQAGFGVIIFQANIPKPSCALYMWLSQRKPAYCSSHKHTYWKKKKFKNYVWNYACYWTGLGSSTLVLVLKYTYSRGHKKYTFRLVKMIVMLHTVHGLNGWHHLCSSIKASFCRLPNRKTIVIVQNYDRF